jgi:hypothetical protein
VTRLSREGVDQRLVAAPFVADTTSGEDNRRRGARIVLDWLAALPGDTWHQRWTGAGAHGGGGTDWRRFPLAWRQATTSWDCRFDPKLLGPGLLSLICADVIRPDLAWLLTTPTPKRLATEMARTRDPAGLGEVIAHCAANPVGETTTQVALHRIAVILAVKGGVVADIVTGDCLEVLRVAAEVCHADRHHSPYFYQLLHARGVLGEGSAATVRALSGPRQLSVEQLIDRCGIVCRPVRDVLVDYLRERQAGLDHVTLVRLADALGRLFWRDLEIHHPGIDGLRLAPAVAAGWKQRISTKTVRRAQPDGSTSEVHSPRRSALNVLIAVRAFYLDIPQWATDDPARWGPWAVPCPIKSGELPTARKPPAASPTWTPAPANVCLSWRPWSPRWPPNAPSPPSVSPSPRPPAPGNCSPPLGRPCAGRSPPAAPAPPSGPKPPTVARDATSPWRNTAHSGLSPPWKYCGTAVSGSRS